MIDFASAYGMFVLAGAAGYGYASAEREELVDGGCSHSFER